jgi:PPOX class probable F420-dependent enzyme
MPMIPEEMLDLLSPEKRAFMNLALVLSDGTPQVSPIWFEYDGRDIIINTARGRLKDKVLCKHPWVACSIAEPEDPYRYLLIRGPVVGETEEGGYEMICRLNAKYHGTPDFPKVPGQVRVTYRIRPVKVFAEDQS